MSGQELGREFNMDGGNCRREIRSARVAFPDLPWRDDPRSRKRAAEVPASKVLVNPLGLSHGSRGIGVFDFHHPFHHERLWDNILRFTADFKPDVWVWGGDNEEMRAVSHWLHDGNKRRQLEGVRLVEDYEDFNTDALDPLNKILPRNCRRVMLKGNHEFWLDRYLDEHPEQVGTIEMERYLHLDGYELYDYGLSAAVGKLHFIHGEYINLHNAYKTVTVYGRNIVYGHGHTFQAHTQTTPLDMESHTAMQVPCACVTNPENCKNRPNAWLNGFLVFYVDESGNFNTYPVIAVDGKFTAPNGKRYA